jgi:hypothetical protein
MWRAYEESIRSHLARLNRWITDSELLVSRSQDEETRRNVEADLARWCESRDRYEGILFRTKWLNRFVSWTSALFWSSFVLLCVMLGVISDHESLLSTVIIVVGMFLVIASGLAYPIAIVARDAAALGYRPWRFSLRSLLVVMTLVAFVLGAWFYAVRC